MTQKFDKEFKLNAVQLYLKHPESLEKIAQDLGVSRAPSSYFHNFKRVLDYFEHFNFCGLFHVFIKSP